MEQTKRPLWHLLSFRRWGGLVRLISPPLRDSDADLLRASRESSGSSGPQYIGEGSVLLGCQLTVLIWPPRCRSFIPAPDQKISHVFPEYKSHFLYKKLSSRASEVCRIESPMMVALFPIWRSGALDSHEYTVFFDHNRPTQTCSCSAE